MYIEFFKRWSCYLVLCRAKYINVTLALSTTKYLINETEYIPWESALNNLGYFILMFDRSEVFGPMQVSIMRSGAHGQNESAQLIRKDCRLVFYSLLCLQKYLRKQVDPLYKHFQEYTDNATVPVSLSDQYVSIWFV